jgi:formamidopyrimidine-DNA glycosylase
VYGVFFNPKKSALLAEKDLRKTLGLAVNKEAMLSEVLNNRDTSGKPGNFQKVLKVYQKDGAKCQSCDTIIKRVKIGQRSAFYCPKCQK